MGDTTGCDLFDVLYLAEHDPQLVQRFEKSLNVIGTTERLSHWTSPLGEFWSPFKTDVNFVVLEHSSNPYQAGSVRIRPGDVVLDCGANIGVFTRRALDEDAARVIAIEPSPLNVEALEKTFAAEIVQGRVTVVSKALWDEPGTMKLKLYDNSLLDSLVMEDRFEGNQVSEVDVELITIDQVVRALNLETVDFIKMDIEGAERNTLRGAVETLRAYHPQLSIATENLPDDIHAVPAAVSEAVPAYSFLKGACRIIAPRVIRPEILYFQIDDQS